MKFRLFAFQEFRKKKINFSSIDLVFYEEFVDFLAHDFVQARRKTLTKGLKVNTIGKTIKQLRVFIRNRVQRKIVAPIDLDGFKILEEDADAIYLTEQEIQALYDLDLSGYPHLETHRDLFVFGCLTGLRFSDFTTIRPEDVRNKKLYKKQEESDHWVVVPLREKAYLIFANKLKNNFPRVTKTDFNIYINKLGGLRRINDLITFPVRKAIKILWKQRPSMKG